MADPTSTRPGFARLGSGSSHDRFGFRLVLATLWRCAGLLRPVALHVTGLAVGYMLIAAVMMPTVLILFDLFWTRALVGQPLTLQAAQAFGLDPSVATHVSALDAETRRVVARGAMLLALVIFGGMLPVIIGLYYYQMWILQRVNQTLRLELLERLQTLSLRFHAENQIGDAIYRIYQDSAMVTQLIDVLFLTPLFALARFALVTGLVALFDPWLSLLMLALWLPALLLSAWYSRPLRVGFRAAREANSALTSRIQETLAGMKVLKAYGAETREQQRFEQSSLAAFAAARSARSRLARFGLGTFWLIGVTLLIGIAIASDETADGDPLYAGAVLASAGLAAWNLGLYNGFKFLLGTGTDQLRLLFRTWGRTQDVVIGLDRVFELLDLEPEVQDAPDAVPLPAVARGVRYRGVTFRYQADRPAIDAVDFAAERGAVTAIVGPTGAGKSTVVSLLLRLFDPQQGAIEIDGRDLRGFRIDSVRSRIAIALQENVLFGTTIRDNIRYGVPDADDAAVREAARVACAEGFIESLPGGYDTLLGERGAKLSSGQRQRLSIARAVLKAPDVLVLDEPTASLDAVTERQVLDRLAEWGRQRTILLITHRLSTIRRADHIVVLAGGRVAEQGSHASLLARAGGIYRSLVESESAAPEQGREAAGGSR